MKTFAVLAKSIINGRLLLLGEGDTKEDAIVDAYGPKGELKSVHWVEEFDNYGDLEERLRTMKGRYGN